MDSKSFHNMDLQKYKNILNDLQEEKNLDYLEKRYKKLISNYSKAYLYGSKWYVGDSFKKYVINININYLYVNKLENIREILLKIN